jgi:hypothetical protein
MVEVGKLHPGGQAQEHRPFLFDLQRYKLMVEPVT